MVLEKDGDLLDRSFEKLGILYRVKEEGNIQHTIKKRKPSWIGHILHRKCLLQHVTEENIEMEGGERYDRKTKKKKT
jgi:hypothetical protein